MLMLKCPPAPPQSLGRNCDANKISAMERWTALFPLQLIVECRRGREGVVYYNGRPHQVQSNPEEFEQPALKEY